MKHAAGIILLAMSVGDIGTALSHTHQETNDIVRTMLSPLLVRTSVVGDRIVRKPMTISTQDAFFAEGDGWTSSEKRGAFDWYLRHLGSSARCSMQTGASATVNPLAKAALRQCAAMSYTNALSSISEYASGDERPARQEAIGLAVEWHDMDEWMAEFVHSIATNDLKYAVEERNFACRKFCEKLCEEIGNGGTNSNAWIAGVQSMYDVRTNSVSAVAIDGMLISCVPGYAVSSNRLACAIAVLADTNAWPNCISYFAGVTNQLSGCGGGIR